MYVAYSGAEGVNRLPKLRGKIPQTWRLFHRERFFCLVSAYLFLGFISVSCGTTAPSVPRETPLPTEAPAANKSPSQPNSQPSGAGGIVDEIRFYTENGSPSSLLRALDIIRSRDLGSTEFGRVMIAVNVALLKALYPSVQAQLPVSDPPLTHSYSRILKDAEKGIYTPPQPSSTDYLEYVLPFLAYYPDGNPGANGSQRGAAGAGGRTVPAERLLSALPDLEKGAALNGDSALAVLFMGIVYENTGRPDDAFTQYSRAWDLCPDCYPAALGLARIMDAQGRKQDTVPFLQDLVTRFPDNQQVKRQLALAYYRSGDWSRAEAAVAEILQRDSRDAEFVLMRARIFVEEGQFLQAQAPLDIYATINPNSRLYLFLRARVQFEGYHNRDAALNYLRAIIRSAPATGAGGDSALLSTASQYAARLLMESPRPEDQVEGRDLLKQLLADPNPSLDVISLALEDAIRREAWKEAQPYLTRLLDARRSSQDLLAAATVERGQGNNAAALSYARELYERDHSNEEGVIAYISALIDTGRQDEASKMIESRLNGMPGGTLKSRYYYLRSRVRNNEELAMIDLRSSLFEDPRNLDTLTAMFEFYYRRKDERRAVYYLKQALALAPDNPRLKRYESEYAAALGSSY